MLKTPSFSTHDAIASLERWSYLKKFLLRLAFEAEVMLYLETPSVLKEKANEVPLLCLVAEEVKQFPMFQSITRASPEFELLLDQFLEFLPTLGLNVVVAHLIDGPRGASKFRRRLD